MWDNNNNVYDSILLASKFGFLDIVVERRWFGLAQASPVRLRVRDGAGAVARDASAEENEAAARLLEETS